MKISTNFGYEILWFYRDMDVYTVTQHQTCYNLHCTQNVYFCLNFINLETNNFINDS